MVQHMERFGAHNDMQSVCAQAFSLQRYAFSDSFLQTHTGLRLTDLLGLIAAQIPVAREANPAVDYAASFKMKIRTASLFGLCAQSAGLRFGW